MSAPGTIADVAQLLRSHHRRMGAADDTYPLIEDLFELDTYGIVQFRRGGTHWPSTTGVVDGLHLRQLNLDEHVFSPVPLRKAAIAGKLGSAVAPATRLATLRSELRRVELHEQLRLMAGWSNNISANIVTHAIGFPNLWVLARRSALFRPRGWERLSTTGGPAEPAFASWNDSASGCPGDPRCRSPARRGPPASRARHGALVGRRAVELDPACAQHRGGARARAACDSMWPRRRTSPVSVRHSDGSSASPFGYDFRTKMPLGSALRGDAE